MKIKHCILFLFISITSIFKGYGETSIESQQIFDDYNVLCHYGAHRNLAVKIDENGEIEEELDCGFNGRTIHLDMNVSDCNILDYVIPYIEKSVTCFIPNEYGVLSHPDYTLTINIFPTMYTPDDLSQQIDISKNSSYLLDIVYNERTGNLDRYVFNYDEYRFSSYAYINPWYKGIIDTFECPDNFGTSDDFFVCWSFEVFCGEIVKAYLIDGWCDYRVYDLISNKEITTKEYIFRLMHRRLSALPAY